MRLWLVCFFVDTIVACFYHGEKDDLPVGGGTYVEVEAFPEKILWREMVLDEDSDSDLHMMPTIK